MAGGVSLESTARERAAIVGLAVGVDRPVDVEHSLEELRGLAAAAGVRVVLGVVQALRRPDPALLLGRGKVEALALACDEAGADLVIFNNELSPAQLRNLERVLDRRVLDRTQLIRDLFAARTGLGRGAFIDLVMSKLSRDVECVTLVFDDDSAADRQRITELYRSGRVLAHVTRHGRASIEADVPRRALPYLNRYLIGDVGLRMGAK